MPTQQYCTFPVLLVLPLLILVLVPVLLRLPNNTY